jgi:hypothetical protein
MDNVARDSKGRFADSGHTAEAGQRDANRYPTVAHDNTHSVGSHTGTMLRGVGVATAKQQRQYERRAKR